MGDRRARACAIAVLLFASACADDCLDSTYGATGSFYGSGTYSCSSPSVAPTWSSSCSTSYNDDDFTAADMCCDCGGGCTSNCPSPGRRSASPLRRPVHRYTPHRQLREQHLLMLITVGGALVLVLLLDLVRRRRLHRGGHVLRLRRRIQKRQGPVAEADRRLRTDSDAHDLRRCDQRRDRQ